MGIVKSCHTAPGKAKMKGGNTLSAQIQQELIAINEDTGGLLTEPQV